MLLVMAREFSSTTESSKGGSQYKQAKSQKIWAFSNFKRDYSLILNVFKFVTLSL